MAIYQPHCRLPSVILIFLPLLVTRPMYAYGVSDTLVASAHHVSGTSALDLFDPASHDERNNKTESIASFSSSDIFRRANKIKQPAPASDADFNALARKGCNLLYLMSASSGDALIRMKRNSALASLQTSQSAWTNAAALSNYGWVEKKDKAKWPYMGIRDMMKALGIDMNDKDNINVQLLQSTVVSFGGKTYAASGGVYTQMINVKAGLVIPYYIYSPKHEVKANGVSGEVIPLNQYSDVLFLEYSKLSGRTKADPKGLKYFLFLNVENVGTWALVMRALKNRSPTGSLDLPVWPGVSFSMNEPEGKALLATQIGSPLAWMLIQHKAQLGLKTAVKVQIFRNTGMTNQDTDQPYPSLLFSVSTVNTASSKHCDPQDACCCPNV